MANKYGQTSLANLMQVHPELAQLMTEVLVHWDHSVTDGIRTIAEQKKNIARGVSQTMDSKHLPRKEDGSLAGDGRGLAHAVDVVPYPFAGWGPIQKMLDHARIVDPTFQTFEFYGFLGFVQGYAAAKGIDIRLGADWDGDREFSEHTFIDLPHIELRRKS